MNDKRTAKNGKNWVSLEVERVWRWRQYMGTKGKFGLPWPYERVWQKFAAKGKTTDSKRETPAAASSTADKKKRGEGERSRGFGRGLDLERIIGATDSSGEEEYSVEKTNERQKRKNWVSLEVERVRRWRKYMRTKGKFGLPWPYERVWEKWIYDSLKTDLHSKYNNANIIGKFSF